MRIFQYTLAFGSVIISLISCQSNSEKVSEKNQSSKEVLQATFVGSTACQSCHPGEFKSWNGSHHQLAMQEATAETVLADFNTSVEFNGVKTHFRKDNNQFFVKTIGSNGQEQEYKIVYTFGITPLQQYIAEFPDGSYQCLQTAWDTQKNKWFDLQPNLKIEAGEWLHWTGNAMKWNTACADCHSTDLKKNFNSKTITYQTQFAEINVGCEACHGPASAHVSFYDQKKTGTPPVLYMKKGMPGPELVEKCARCHSRRTQLTEFFDYQGHYLDHYEPQLITSPTYEADGQILDEDYVYGSFVQSKMYENGVACRDCHDMHSMKLKAIGNTLCLQCHQSSYDSPAHHFHPIGTSSAECINCHMTGKTYMGNDFRRDHSFRIPRPDQSVTFGTPNACNNCHSDKSAAWAAENVKRWYGPERKDHFSDHLLAGYQGEKAELLYLLEHQEYPEIARASAASYLTNMLMPEDAANIKKYLKDQSPLVRNETVKLIGALQPTDGADLLTESLKDPIRMVRINAVEILNNWGAESTDPSFLKVQDEFWLMLKMNADFPGGQQRLANYHQAKGEMNQAIAAYEEALRIDNYNNMTRMNLALLKYQLGQVQASEKLYLEVIAKEPEVSYPYYMLGLLYNEQNDPQKARKYMEKACSKEPYLERAYYNYAIMLQQQNKYEESLELTKKATKLGGDTQEGILYMKLLAEINLNRKSQAQQSAQQLVNISNKNPRYVSILNSLKNE